REHAPWALEYYGFQAIVAPSFAYFFHSNCSKIGLLPITVEDHHCQAIAEAGEAEIDLEEQVIRYGDEVVAFEIDAEIKHRLRNGLDDIGLTLQQGEAIDSFERDRERTGPNTATL
ncbi:MAG: 3-isopropylmalate/(R)-2-methylmalate dehydratase small subunit, partial [Thermoleophilaceae bacterium]|nr:3-isopropylmalate/(R)-2-methylmalate dehydratase small subunit [Thermoleophilaceae bacterium]